MKFLFHTKRTLLVITLTFSLLPLFAQKFKYSIPGLDTIQTFIVSGGSSTVLRNGQAEVISNSILNSYRLNFHQNGENSPILDRFRRSQFISDLFVFYGVSPSGRWDAGLQIKYGRSRLDNAASSSIFKVFEGTSSEDESDDPNAFIDQTFGNVANIGLRFRVMPITSVPQLVINGGYLFSSVKDETEQVQLGADRDAFDIGITYFREINVNTFYFFGANGQVFLPNSIVDEALYNTGASFFLVQRTTNQRFTFYPGLAYQISFKPSVLDSNPDLIKVVDFLFAYAGAQYAPNRKFNIFVNAGLPLIVNTTNPQQIIDRPSYSLISLGFRVGVN